MRIRRETKAYADLQQEFKVTRYLWTFAKEWRCARKTNLLPTFWVMVSRTLEHYDMANPTG